VRAPTRARARARAPSRNATLTPTTQPPISPPQKTHTRTHTQQQQQHKKTDTEFDHALLDRSLPAEQQLDALLRAGAARRAHLQLRHLARVLAAASLSAPAQVLLGLPAGGGYAHVMFVYRNPRGNEPFDDSLGLSFKLPVREDDDDIEPGGGDDDDDGEEGGDQDDPFAFNARAPEDDDDDGRAAAAVGRA
jgi:hypothetical protein